VPSQSTDPQQWTIKISCYTPNTDSGDWDTAAYGSTDFLTDTVSASAGRLFTISDASLMENSCTEGDDMNVVISTDAIDGTNDDATGDRELRGFTIYEN